MVLLCLYCTTAFWISDLMRKWRLVLNLIEFGGSTMVITFQDSANKYTTEHSTVIKRNSMRPEKGPDGNLNKMQTSG